MRFTSWKRYFPLLLATLLLADLLSKFWIDQNVPHMGAFPFYPYGGIGIFRNFLGIEFSISHLTNRGAAWGILGEFQETLLVGRILLISGMLLYLLYFNRDPAWRVPMSLVITGAIGNIIDYFIYGHVVDMLHFVLWGYDFPVFNIADCAVTLGIAWMIALSCWQEYNTKYARGL